jgi:hypothetical protein
VGAESLPASIRACAAETDSLKRLVCYDREVARFPEPKATDSKATTHQHDGAANPPNTGDGAAATTAAANGAAPAAPATPPNSGGSGTTAAAANSSAPPAPASPPQPQQSRQEAGHFSARVVSIDHIPNEMVLHLDNGQAWQEMQSVPGDLSLQVGDTVKIDKRLGSYWLTGPHVSGMKVRQKS